MAGLKDYKFLYAEIISNFKQISAESEEEQPIHSISMHIMRIAE